MRSIVFIYLLILAIPGFNQIADNELVNKAYDEQNPTISVELLNQINDVEALVDTVKNRYYLSMGIAYGKLGKGDSSKLFLYKCIDNSKATGDDFNQMRAHNSLGVLYRITGEHAKSLEAFQNAEKIIEKNSDNRFLTAKSDVLGNIGGIFYQLKDYESARKYSTQGLRIAQQFNDTSELAYGNLRLAIVAQAQDSIDQSLAYNKKAGEYLQKLGDYNTLAYVQNNLGNIYTEMGDYARALNHQKEALTFAEKFGDIEGEANALNAIGESYFKLGELNNSKKYAERTVEIADSKGFPLQSRKGHDLLSKIAEKRGNYKIALAERLTYMAINDSLNAVDTRERLKEVETRYETEKKEAEIARLSLENELKDSNLRRARYTQVAVAVGSLLLIIILLTFFYFRYKKQEAEKESKEFQIEALQKRLFDLNLNPYEKQFDIDRLNDILKQPLTEREFEVLDLSLQEKTNSQIGEKLFISKSTVKFHLRNTYKKLGVNNRREALAYINKTS